MAWGSAPPPTGSTAEARTAATRAVRLLHISDLHCGRDPAQPLHGQLSDRNLASLLARSSRTDGRPDVVACSGDVADDASPPVYARVAARLRGLARHPLWVPGNHDTAPHMRALAPRGFPDRATVGAWQLLLLDSSWPGHDQGRIGPAQLAWLDAHLQGSQRHAAVMLHHPPIPACDDPDCQLSDAGRLLAVLDRHAHVRVVLSGHNHRPFDHRRGSTMFLGAPSTCRQIHHHRSGHAWTDEGPAARAVTLHPGGRVDHHVTWLRTAGREPELSWWDADAPVGPAVSRVHAPGRSPT